MSFHIRLAEAGDVHTLRAMAERFLLAELPVEAAERHGFLVSNFTIEEYQRFVEHADHFYVLEDEQGLAGFILAYSRERIGSDETVNLAVADRYPQPFVLIKQICVLPERSGRGYARTLYDYVRQASGELPQFAAVVLEPYNGPSVVFHQRLGFRQVMQLTAPDGLPRAIYARDLVEDASWAQN